MAISALRDVAGQTVGYAAALVIGTPIVASYHIGFNFTRVIEKLTDLSVVFDKSYATERNSNNSASSSALLALDSVVRSVFPNTSMQYESLCERALKENMLRAKQFHQGNL